MKKILLTVLALVLALSCFVACGTTENTTAAETTTEGTGDVETPTEKNYSLVVVMDSAVNATSNKVSNTVLALVIDAGNKIVAARFDAVDATPALDADGNLVAVTSVQTKVEQGDAYTGMAAGSWAKQTKAFGTTQICSRCREIARKACVAAYNVQE